MGSRQGRKITGLVIGALLLLGAGLLVRFHGSDPRPPEKPDEASASGSETLPDSDETMLAGQVESAAACSIRVTVFEGYDKKLADAEVRAVGEDRVVRTGVTNAEGIAILDDLPAGRVRVAVSAVGYAAPEEQTVDLTEGEPGKLGFRLEPGGPLTGRVVDAADGRPVRGAVVTAMVGGAVNMNPCPPQVIERVHGTATTKENGRFTIECVPRDPFFALRLTKVEAEGYRTLWKVAPPDGKDDHFVIRLVPGGSVEGVIRTPDGMPVAGAEVVATLAAGEHSDPLRYVDRIELPERFTALMPLGSQKAAVHVVEDVWTALVATTDAAGRYAIHGLGLGEKYAVAARAADYAPSETMLAVLATSARRRTQRDLLLRKPCRLTVRCLDSLLKPWPGISVRVEGPSPWAPALAATKADDRGVARFQTLVPGRFFVCALECYGGAEARVELIGQPGENEITLTLDRPYVPLFTAAPAEVRAEKVGPPRPQPPRQVTLRARFKVPEGVTPPLTLNVRGWSGGTSGWSEQAWTPDESGAVLLEWTWDLPSYRLVVSARDFLPLVREVRRSPGSTADLGVLTLDPGETLSGIVRLPDETPLSGVTVRVAHAVRNLHPQTFTRERETSADGSFRLKGLPADFVEIEMSDLRFLPFKTKVALPLEVPLALEVRPGSVLHVHATDEDGHPATRRTVSLRTGGGDGESAAYGRTNAEGVFTARVEPGTYWIALGGNSRTRSAETTHRVDLADGEQRVVPLVASAIE
jgi:Carboxypeptidase regulatory-like domain